MSGIFGLSFEGKNDRIENTGHFLLKVQIKDCNVMIDEQNAFDQQVKMI